MKQLLVAWVICAIASPLFGFSIKGELLNGDDPWIVRADSGEIYKAEWFGGSPFWDEGDRVLLTKDSGFCEMISLGADEKHSRVWVEEVD